MGVVLTDLKMPGLTGREVLRAAKALSPDVDVIVLTGTDPAFCANPYPVLDALREATPIWFDERTNQWTVTRFAEVTGIPLVPPAGTTPGQRAISGTRMPPS